LIRKWVDKENKAGATQRRVVFSSLINYLPDQPIPAAKLLWGMTGGASRQSAQPCLVRSLPGRPAKRIKAAKGDFLSPVTGHYNYAAGNRESGNTGLSSLSSLSRLSRQSGHFEKRSDEAISTLNKMKIAT
jgi:hypothetical protein